MNFLQLVAAGCSECGVTAPSTVVAQTGESLRMVNWTNSAWIDIQSAHENWLFQQNAFTFATVTNQVSYTPAQANTTNFGDWKRDSLRIYRTGIGRTTEIWLGEQDYDSFRNLYQFGAMLTNYQQPVVFAVDPDKKLLLGPGPDATGYTVVGEYFTAPIEMAADADIPALPTQYHRAIVYRAMMFYGAFESAGEVYQQGETEYKKIMARLENNQLPSLEMGGPML